MTLYELQKVLGERIEITNDLAMSDEERKKENEKKRLRLLKFLIKAVKRRIHLKREKVTKK